eukprot:757595-Hanusia_phi.AAC.2
MSAVLQPVTPTTEVPRRTSAGELRAPVVGKNLKPVAILEADASDAWPASPTAFLSASLSDRDEQWEELDQQSRTGVGKGRGGEHE